MIWEIVKVKAIISNSNSAYSYAFEITRLKDGVDGVTECWKIEFHCSSIASMDWSPASNPRWIGRTTFPLAELAAFCRQICGVKFEFGAFSLWECEIWKGNLTPSFRKHPKNLPLIAFTSIQQVVLNSYAQILCRVPATAAPQPTYHQAPPATTTAAKSKHKESTHHLFPPSSSTAQQPVKP